MADVDAPSPPVTDDALWPAAPKSGSVALLGGSFNPPHVAHALLAQTVLATQPLDALWVLPCADHAFGKPLAPFADRVAMCRKAFRWLPAVTVVEVEAHLPTPNFTVQTLRALKAARPELRPHWIIGTDILQELHRWQDPEAVKALCTFVVVPRAGHLAASRRPDEATARQLPFVLPEISSTEIRRRQAARQSLDGWVDAAVAEYISSNGLYTDANAT